jgi:diadenosine tetraphosphate (Ap4A) HIT family hydrolase
VSDCPFCSKLAVLDQLPVHEVVWRFPRSVALLGPWQFYRGYCVLVSQQHATELSGLDDAARRTYLDEMCLLARAIELAYRPAKLNYELLGNQVGHLHWHLFPRYAADPDARRPVWLTLDRAEHDPNLRQRLEAGSEPPTSVAEALRQSLTALGAPRV